MSTLAPSKTFVFTIKEVPAEPRRQKTIHRLMRMNSSVQGALNRLSTERIREKNRRTARAGRIWLARVECTKVVTVKKGASFTLRLTPQIMADVKSVEKYLDAKVA
ncbi:MAG: hypothetical protein U0636_12665 [Phycisphaerales bacterium]